MVSQYQDPLYGDDPAYYGGQVILPAAPPPVTVVNGREYIPHPTNPGEMILNPAALARGPIQEPGPVTRIVQAIPKVIDLFAGGPGTALLGGTKNVTKYALASIQARAALATGGAMPVHTGGTQIDVGRLVQALGPVVQEFLGPEAGQVVQQFGSAFSGGTIVGPLGGMGAGGTKRFFSVGRRGYVGYINKRGQQAVMRISPVAHIGKNMPSHRQLTRLRRNLSRQATDARTILRLVSPKSLRQPRGRRRR